jgi:hypothetical protein
LPDHVHVDRPVGQAAEQPGGYAGPVLSAVPLTVTLASEVSPVTADLLLIVNAALRIDQAIPGCIDVLGARASPTWVWGPSWNMLVCTTRFCHSSAGRSSGCLLRFPFELELLVLGEDVLMRRTMIRHLGVVVSAKDVGRPF